MFSNIKKINFIILLFIFISIFAIGIIPIFSFAVTVYKGEVAGPGGTAKIGSLPEGAGITKIDQLLDILADILKYIYTIFFIVAVMFILFAAYTYLTAQDDPEKIKSATKQIMWASVAIVVALMSLSFNVIIKNFIKPSGGSSGSSQLLYMPDGSINPNYTSDSKIIFK
ncbi:MAG: hypothetical protein AAB396_02255 [Patescibacteria group bacterium]